MNKLLTFINSLNLKEGDEITFFGGSFNPWHEGHSECIKKFPKDKALIVIPDHNPHKDLVNNSLKQEGLEFIKDKVKNSRTDTYFYEGFFLENKLNPTVLWIKQLKDAKPKTPLSLLLGFDSFKNIIHWNEPEILIKSLHSLYVVSRLETEGEKEEALNNVLSLNKNLKVTFLGRHPFEHVSSTAIRKSFKY